MGDDKERKRMHLMHIRFRGDLDHVTRTKLLSHLFYVFKKVDEKV